MYSIGKVLSILPIPRIMEYLNIILAPSFKEIQELLNVDPVCILFEYDCVFQMIL